MKRLIIGIIVGCAICAPSVWALRIARPITFTEIDQNSITQLNDILLQIFNVLNGRYQSDVVTSDPDGSRACSVGEAVLFDTATDRWCVCVNSSTKQWNCVDIT